LHSRTISAFFSSSLTDTNSTMDIANFSMNRLVDLGELSEARPTASLTQARRLTAQSQPLQRWHRAVEQVHARPATAGVDDPSPTQNDLHLTPAGGDREGPLIRL
jgi:hypothetical protein